jgi:cytoskeletal protein CcmA (bactofilin family)
MAQPFFGRREPDPLPSRPAPASPAPTAVVPAALQAPAAQASARPVPTPQAGERLARLAVGPHIKLKGLEITDCDTLFVEGSVEATMKSRVIEIAEIGTYKGEAEIETAEIHGHFEGSLTVREKLVIHATGRVHGTVRCGRLVIAEGGQLSGDVLMGALGAKDAQPLPRVA